MSRTIVIVWLGATAPGTDHDADLQSWAEARTVRLSEPAAPTGPRLRHDDALVEQLEAALTDTRIALGAADEDAARARLDFFDRALRGAPHLPQSAWLMSEALYARATLARARGAPASEVTVLERRARELGGPRARAFSAAPATPPAETGSARTAPRVAVHFDGVREGDRLVIDGDPKAEDAQLSVGEHHLRVVRSGSNVWAGWIRVSTDQPRVVLDVPLPAPCTRDDFVGVRFESGRMVITTAPTCPRWVAARPAKNGRGIALAQCSGRHCDPPTSWERPLPKPTPPRAGPPPDEDRRFPTWLAWSLVGVAAIAATGVAAWQLTVNDDAPPPPPTVTFTGPSRP